MGNYLGQNENVQKTAAGTIANDARVAGQPDGTLDPDTASAYTGAGGSISNSVASQPDGTSDPNTASSYTGAGGSTSNSVANQSDGTLYPNTDSAYTGAGSISKPVAAACDVLAIHNHSAHSSTYGRWFPHHVTKLNLGQTKYEHAGRKFLNEESVKKGIRTPLAMDSEAEVLGRLLWKVHLAAITQNCMNDAPASVKTTMKDELELMRKVHQIQNSITKSSISGTACSVNGSTQPKHTASCSTTGLMNSCGDNRPGGYQAPSYTRSSNSDVPNVSGNPHSYSSNYKPRNPNKKPKPYDSIWDIF